MKKQFPTFVDETAEKFEKIYFSAGKVGHQVCIKPDDLGKIVPFSYVELW
jgi:Cys-tRNA(Pro)/Cys-tRNA(Cys) deacylase